MCLSALDFIDSKAHRRGLAMSDGPTDPKTPEPDRSLCARCGATVLKLVAIIPKAQGNPTSKIFRCIACGFHNWQAQDDL
jgi:hypothetical protein